MRSKHIEEIDLFQIAKSQSIGPIVAGANLMEIGNALGAPQHWELSTIDKTFIGILHFGEVEVNCETRDNIVRVSFAKFYMHSFKNGLLPFAKLQYRDQTWIRCNFKPTRALYPVVEKSMQQAGIPFKTDIVVVTPHETLAVMRFGKGLGFYFDFDHPDQEFELAKSRLWYVGVSGAEVG